MTAQSVLKSLTIAAVPLFGSGIFRYMVLIGSSIDRWEYRQIIGVEVVWIGIPSAICTFLAALYIISRESHSYRRMFARIASRPDLSLEQQVSLATVHQLMEEEIGN